MFNELDSHHGESQPECAQSLAPEAFLSHFSSSIGGFASALPDVVQLGAKQLGARGSNHYACGLSEYRNVEALS
jgi:hypothetical protein